jgi:hypothetical protein
MTSENPTTMEESRGKSIALLTDHRVKITSRDIVHGYVHEGKVLATFLEYEIGFNLQTSTRRLESVQVDCVCAAYDKSETPEVLKVAPGTPAEAIIDVSKGKTKNSRTEATSIWCLESETGIDQRSKLETKVRHSRDREPEVNRPAAIMWLSSGDIQ